MKFKSKLFGEQKGQAEGFFPLTLLREQKGQAEAVFRLMIDSIVGLIILGIIVSAYSYFNSQIYFNSIQELKQIVGSSASASDGTLFTSSELSFVSGYAFDAIDAEAITNISADCFKLQAREGPMSITDDKKVEFKQTLKIVVYSRCVPDNSTCNPYDQSSCCIDCLVSFGIPIE